MTQIELLTQTALSSWKLVIGRIDQALSSTGDESLDKEVAPGRNRVFYLLGHLTAVHDRLFPLLGIGERLHPELDADFLDNPDRHSADKISGADLRKAWFEVNTKLTAAFEALRPEQWLEKHTAVSEQDFEKDPLRNRLAVLLSRTNHVAFHSGQMRLTQ
ncbi:MAG: DinB family protein [Bryobacteraceae bacterium]